jgi:MerC mercury resistance protein
MMLKRLKRHSHLLHKTGMFLSVICLIHCLATPIIITVLPFIAEGWISHNTEIALVLISTLIALYLMLKDYKIHGNLIPLLVLIVAFSLQIIGLFIVQPMFETVFLILGSLNMAIAYFVNWRLHKKVCHNHGH